MDLVLANTVVFRCVRKVGGVQEISAGDELRRVGIASPDHVHSLINVICNNSQYGLPQESYSIDPNVLRDISVVTNVGTVSTLVAQNAIGSQETPE